MPYAIPEYLRRGEWGGKLVAWWERDDAHEALWVVTYDRAAGRFLVASFPRVVSHWSHQVDGSSCGRDGMAAHCDKPLRPRGRRYIPLSLR
jgi:hypothetical protein